MFYNNLKIDAIHVNIITVMNTNWCTTFGQSKKIENIGNDLFNRLLTM